jgi:hypothetical protein
MLGVAGARHVLAKEGYRWIAPVSAFYPEAKTAVAIGDWPKRFIPGALTATAATPYRLRPDYIATKRVGSSPHLEFASIEAKGTPRSMANWTSCPVNWKRQAKNVELKLDGVPVHVSRAIVVATRVNPNAVRSSTRALQIRAWNSQEGEDHPDQWRAGAEVVTAHLFGFFRNLGLSQNAIAIAAGAHSRSAKPISAGAASSGREDFVRSRLTEQRNRADEELSEFGLSDGLASSIVLRVPLEGQTSIKVELTAPLMKLARVLSIARGDQEVAHAFHESEESLDAWDQELGSSRIDRSSSDAHIFGLPFGAIATFPPQFNRLD